ncbi:hypothetical protein IJ579_05150 [bacterium]|nr:hypothetical protein [bacterium]
MRLYNISSKTTSINYIVALIFFLFLELINFVAYGFSVSWHLTFENFYNWCLQIMNLIFNSHSEFSWIYALFMIIFPIIFFFVFVYEYLVRKVEIDKLNKNLNLKYIDFDDNNVFFKFNRSENDFGCSYEQLNILNLEICTRQAYSRYGFHSIISELIIEIEVSNQGKFKSHNIPKDIYEVIRYFAKSKNFHYEITGSGFDIKEQLSKNIDEFLSNGFKKPNIHKQMSSFYLIFAVIFLVLGIIISFNGIFSLIFVNHMWWLLVLPSIFFGVPIILLLIIIKNK